MPYTRYYASHAVWAQSLELYHTDVPPTPESGDGSGGWMAMNPEDGFTHSSCVLPTHSYTTPLVIKKSTHCMMPNPQFIPAFRTITPSTFAERESRDKRFRLAARHCNGPHKRAQSGMDPSERSKGPSDGSSVKLAYIKSLFWSNIQLKYTMANVNPAPVPERYIVPIDVDKYDLNEEETAFFKEQTGILDDDKLKQHIIAAQAEAFAVYPYPCIRRFAFAKLKIAKLPAYPALLKLGKEREGAIFLDIGCCFGNDVRKAVADGYPVQNAIASDLQPGTVLTPRNSPPSHLSHPASF
ncbi:hypothetical protein EVG20_g6512 [Dentipellis fragilis]|uniref:Methyltransferase type 11 domain-containing protein n=1 Tax=Dentipellis fragilis TaxID=205917 RepID=A0A4Y9YMV3_9AGAM|nr:hypothetical protein EVG20_g6512 [Dentipellis fragilis]